MEVFDTIYRARVPSADEESLNNVAAHNGPLATTLITVVLRTSVLFAQKPPADLLLVHGHILTMDSKDSVAQAIAIRDGFIVKIGSDADVLALAGNVPEFTSSISTTTPIGISHGIAGLEGKSISKRS